MVQTFSVPGHPYFPPDADIPHYIPNASPVQELLVRFASLLSITIFTALWLATRLSPQMKSSDKFVLGWFVLCKSFAPLIDVVPDLLTWDEGGSLHCFFEGYFVLNHDNLASSNDLFAQLWKEYALSDSRYLTSDPFMICVETITVIVWGPLCFATAVSICRGGGLRYPFQIIVSLAHLYGVALYYSTCYVNERYKGLVYSRPEFQYFWVYYVGFNAPWVIVPAAILINSVRVIQRSAVAINKAAATLDRRHRIQSDAQ